MLIIFGGLPGVGKSVIARELARRLAATYLRIDCIEQAIRDSAVLSEVNDAGYRVAYVLAEENLLLGRTVIADSVNPLSITRNAWLNVAKRTGAQAVEVEIKCSDAGEHRRRVDSRAADIPGFRLPSWEEVVSREYDPWDRPHLIVDTATSTVEESVDKIRRALQK